MAHDMVAIVLKIRAKKRLEIRSHMGRASQQLAFKIIQQHSAALSEAVHDSQDLKPFTTSSLLYGDSASPLVGSVRAGDRAWVRFTALTRPVTAAFYEYAAEPPVEEEYDKQMWEVEGVATALSEHQWTGNSSYRDLCAENTDKQARKITLHFATPTTFHSKGIDVPLPMPSLVFRSLLDRWNAFAPESLSTDILNFAEQYVAVTRYRTETAMPGGKQRSKHAGFIGDVTFTILNDNPSLAKHDPDLERLLAHAHNEYSRLIITLTEFAFFSGVGRQTTTGMGMCTVV